MRDRNRNAEAQHRKVFTNSTKPDKPSGALLVEGESDFNLKVDILELEVKALSVSHSLAQLRCEQDSDESDGENNSSKWESDEEDTNLEYKKWESKLDTCVFNSLPDTEQSSNKFDPNTFNLLVVNPGGLNGKRQSITNAVHLYDIRAVIVSETHAAGKTVPKLDPSMKAFFHNRSSKANKGGVALFLEASLAKHAVVVGKSSGEHEWIAVKVNYYDPPLLIIAAYGCQAKHRVAEKKAWWEEMWEFMDNFTQRATIILGGDLNAAVGRRFNMTDNCDSDNYGGKLLARGATTRGFRILNGLYKGSQRTHVDRSKESSRCLDYVVTNKPELCSRMYIDNEYLVTPYKVTRHGKGKNRAERKYTDHKAVLTSFELDKEAKAVCVPLSPVTVKNEEGHVKFYELTDHLAETAVELLNSGKEILKVFKIVMRKLSECERLSYTKITRSKIKRKMWSDNEIFMSLTSDLEKVSKSVSQYKVNDKIYKMRSDKLLKEREQELFSMYDHKGNLVEDRESILDVLTQYNKDLLGRSEHPERFQEIFMMKKSVCDFLDKTVVKDFDTITPRDYVRAIQKITNKGKGMFKQFLRASPKFHAVMYFVFRRMYEEEVIPENFLETVLIALFKKGDPRKATQYRYLHLRSDVSRFFQLLVYLKLENHFDSHTDESQMGGRKMGDTIEHLAMVASVTKAKEEEQEEGVIWTMADAIKCFDASHLSDNHAALQTEGADRKAMKVLYKYQKKNVLRMAGSEERFVIENGMGQGGIPDARVTTSGITEATVRHMTMLPRDKVLHHRGQEAHVQGYVDDTLTGADTPEAAGLTTIIYGNTLDELALKAHPEKSVQVVMGNTEWVERTVKELEQNPNTMQGFPLRQCKKEKYLGMWLTQSTYEEMISYNISVKRGLLLGAASEIRNLCSLPQIRRFGKAQAQRLMCLSQLVPVCLYSTPAWIAITEEQYEELEDAFKAALVTVMSVPKYVKYSALLKVLGLPFIEHFLDCIKLKIWNHKLNVKRKGRMYRLLLHEIAFKIEGGLAQDLSCLSRKYGIGDITEEFVDPEVISRACKQASYVKIWTEHLTLRHVPLMITANKQAALYHEMPWHLSRGMVMLDLGLLVTKCSQPHLMLRRNMAHKADRSCLHPFCDQRDEWSHLLAGCPFYSSKLDNEHPNPTLAVAEHIHRLNMERIRLFSQSLVLFGDGEELLANVALDSDYVTKSANVYSRKNLVDLVTKFDGLGPEPETKVDRCEFQDRVSRLDQMSLNVVRNMEIRVLPYPDRHGWQHSTANTARCSVTASCSLIRGSGLGSGKRAVKADRSRTWPQFLDELHSSVTIDESKLRSAKQYHSVTMSDNIKVTLRISAHMNEVEIMGPSSRAAATVTMLVSSKEALRSETQVSITGPTAGRKSLGIKMLSVSRELRDNRSVPNAVDQGETGNPIIHLVKNREFDLVYKNVKVEAELDTVPRAGAASGRSAEAGAPPRRRVQGQSNGPVQEDHLETYV